MAIDRAAAAAALRIPDSSDSGDGPLLDRLVAVAIAIVEDYAPNAPQAVKDEAGLRLVGRLYDLPPENNQGTAGMLNGSGASGLLSRWRARSAHLVDPDPQAGGTQPPPGGGGASAAGLPDPPDNGTFDLVSINGALGWAKRTLSGVPDAPVLGNHVLRVSGGVFEWQPEPVAVPVPPNSRDVILRANNGLLAWIARPPALPVAPQNTTAILLSTNGAFSWVERPIGLPALPAGVTRILQVANGVLSWIAVPSGGGSSPLPALPNDAATRDLWLTVKKSAYAWEDLPGILSLPPDAGFTQVFIPILRQSSTGSGRTYSWSWPQPIGASKKRLIVQLGTVSWENVS